MGLDHGPAMPVEPEDDAVVRRNARAGLVLFAVYFAGYAGFVALNAIRPALMETVLPGGVNLAIAYGLGLIGGALGLALVYAWLCRSHRHD